MSVLAKTGFVLAAVAAVGYLAGPDAGTGRAECAPPGVTSPGVAGYGPDEIANAATIVAVGKNMNVPERGWVVAVATAMQESGLRNLRHGDRDSLGLFQQRPSMGWGTPVQVRDPVYSATQFYRRLLAVRGWQRMSVTDAAQAVQRSQFPNAYARHEKTARAIVGIVQGSGCAAA